MRCYLNVHVNGPVLFSPLVKERKISLKFRFVRYDLFTCTRHPNIPTFIWKSFSSVELKGKGVE